jgi:hypothetical protein
VYVLAITGQLHAQLLRVHALLGKVSAMGPLVSLLKAHIVREEFLRTNRDLLDTFGILARGEQLLVSQGVHWTLLNTMTALADRPRVTMQPVIGCNPEHLPFGEPTEGSTNAPPCNHQYSRAVHHPWLRYLFGYRHETGM